MSRRANPTAVGSFVIGAVVLAVAGVVSFGGGQFFAEKVHYSLYFDSSLKGLTVGSAVLFNGVRIGSVTDIIVYSNADEHRVVTPVYIELDTTRVERAGKKHDPRAVISDMVDRGLRANLEMQSLVTGVLAVQMDFHPDTPIELKGENPRYPELPTIPSAMQEVTQTLMDLPIKELVDDLRHSIQGIDELVRSQDIKDAIVTLNQTLKDFGELADHVNEKVDPLATQVDTVATAAKEALDQATTSIASIEDSLDKTLVDVRKLVENVNGQVDPVADSVVGAADSAKTALEQARGTLATIQSAIGDESELTYRLNTMLAELASAARSIRVLADYLEQHPEALLQGKGASGGE